MKRLLLVVALAAAVHPAAAQTTIFRTVQPGENPQAPPGMAGRPAQPGADLPPGTAKLRGRVFAADTGQALRKAQVRLVQQPDGASGGPMFVRENKLATTDAQGTFEFKELRAGRYLITASKGSYVALQYGQNRPTEPGKPIQILDGQTVERVDFSLPRGAVITGRILDEFGEPLPDVTVAPQRYQFVQGQRRLVPAGRTASTNDLGEFRIFGVPPGQYYLQATWRAMNAINLTDGGSRTGYAPMYFPGTLEIAQAQRLTIGVGVEVSDVMMTMRPVKTARVSGVALDSQGQPMRGMLFIMQSSGFMMINMAAPIRPDGTFTVGGISPGEYMFRVQQMGNPSDAEVGTLNLTVGSDDIDGVAIATARPSVLRGHVVVDPAAASSLPARLMLTAMPVQMTPMMGVQPAAVAEDMSFEIKSPPGVYRVNLGGAALGWAIRTVRLNGADVTDSGVEVKANEDLAGLEVELTNKLTSISGLVTNARGETVRDFSAVVFAHDSSLWGSNTRYQSMGRPDQDGRFKISGLPAGNYYIVALDRVDSGEVGDPEFLERIRTKATMLSLMDGETKTVDLKLQTAS
jgi:hypothetical protein